MPVRPLTAKAQNPNWVQIWIFFHKIVKIKCEFVSVLIGRWRPSSWCHWTMSLLLVPTHKNLKRINSYSEGVKTRAMKTLVLYEQRPVCLVIKFGPLQIWEIVTKAPEMFSLKWWHEHLPLQYKRYLDILCMHQFPFPVSLLWAWLSLKAQNICDMVYILVLLSRLVLKAFVQSDSKGCES